jgi:hypothetical protein
MECQGTLRKASKILPRPMKLNDSLITLSTVANTSVGATCVDNLTRFYYRCYKDMSIHFVELPVTLAKFREKYT